MEKIRVGMIGFGGRGRGIMSTELLPMCDDGEIEITAVCDLYEDRMLWAKNEVENSQNKTPFYTQDYHELLKRNDVDAVIVTSAWESHVDIAVDSMKSGKSVGIEVGGAYSLEDCWKLVNTYEETKTPIMFLENCCYGKRELLVLNMVRKGIFGDVVHCEGGYHHDLRFEISHGEVHRHYRLRNYINRNCDNYPTHELGPISKVLDINNGNRFLSLTSTSSVAKGLHHYIVDRNGADDPYANTNFAQGDVVTTVIKCARGETITLTLDTTLPRAYSRGFTVRGTKASYFEDNDSFFFDHEHDEYEQNLRGLWGNASEYEEKYLHDIWKRYTPSGSHDGMDWMVYHAFIDAVRENRRMPIDVYDAAAYMSISTLSEKSISLGSMPVEIPDFTRGKWFRRTDISETPFNLDDIKKII